MKQKIPIIAIVGPTGVGKTDLSLKIARRFDAEIISADSMQVYRGMDIGTAKPTEAERGGIPHHLIDVVNPDEPFSVARYVALAEAAIADIRSRGKIPMLVGGTGLYVESLLYHADFEESGHDTAIRDELTAYVEHHGAEALHAMLAEVDPESAATIHPNNIRRVVRAMEHYRTTGIPISAHNAQTKQKESPYRFALICLTREREELYARIDRRVDIMLADGLLDEVASLLRQGYSRQSTAMQGIGYKEIADYFRGKSTYHECVSVLKRGTRRYAKRQLTWWRRNKDVRYLPLCGDADREEAELVNMIKEEMER